MASSWLAFLLPVLCLGMLQALPTSHAARAFFVFGDSLVDNGNNNYLITEARADTPPYGIDTPDHRATGRFSNGKNVPDIISEHLGAEPLLPYLSPELDGDKLLVGANFASAGVGILNDTGIQFANIIHISKQLLYFAQYQRRLSSLIGAQQTARLVNGALVLITLGGNDFVNNYYLVPYSARSREFSLPDYTTYIVSEYKQILTKLYDLGARRVLVQGVGPIGCVPAELALHSLDGSCDPELQRAAAMYNPRLMAMLGELNAQFGDVFVGVNTQRIHNDFIDDPKAYGFATATEACCGQGRFNGMGLCTMVSRLCNDRDAYVFWDAFHPTERANRLIVQQFMDGSIDYISPMNLSTILAVDHEKNQQLRT
ncbi:GDSL esterase/lipase At5g33370-like [Phragmites australis]|uniref:GDSL esterase/lipase At5g33370-like n=1 Tax=Phragmites australis TaxID=29695 RepID=UPI002D78D0D7|nr:GDSL esterase/lipase At5g33370-like [Phragmites australis]